MKYRKRSKIKNLLLASSLFAATLYGSDEDILASISSAMSHYEEVATTTKNNEHYQPYIISVFEGKDLEKLGIKDLEEALLLTPGIDITTDNFNNRTMIFRGSNPSAYGQTKLFIDGTLVNEVFFDSYTQYLKMPTEMIKRIEVTRGPGSKTDGVNAYAGSIQVITYAEEFEGFESKDKVILKSGSYDYKMGGFVKSYKTGDLKIYTDFYYQQDNKKLYAGPDGYSQGSLSNAIYDNKPLAKTGDAPVWIKNWNLGLNIEYKDFYIKARNNDYTHGSAYGINWALPDDDDYQYLPSRYFEIGFDKEVDNFEISLKAGIKNDSWSHEARLGPAGAKFFNVVDYLSTTDTTAQTTILYDEVSWPEGARGAHLAKQQSKYSSEFIKYNGANSHIITLGHRYLQEDTIDMYSKLEDWAGGVNLVDYTKEFPFFDKDAFRETNIISLQDEYLANNQLSLIYGASYEETTYTDGVIDPRVSLVYQADAENIYKIIYSQSHRNPSWQEMYTKNNSSRAGSTELEPEKVIAYEAAYIKKLSADSYLQANIFKLENKNQIYSSSPPTFKNELDTDIQGLELEYKGNISSSDQFYFNYSYVDGEDNNGEKLANVAKHMTKTYYIYNISDFLSVSGTAKYVGSKERIAGETLIDGSKRNSIDAYTKFDMAIRYYNQQNDYHITLSGKNIFDADIRYPAPYYYAEDYRQEGTNFLLTIAKEY